MGSIWGITWFVLFHGYSPDQIPHMILNIFAASFLQTVIWKIYVKIDF